MITFLRPSSTGEATKSITEQATQPSGTHIKNESNGTGPGEPRAEGYGEGIEGQLSSLRLSRVDIEEDEHQQGSSAEGYCDETVSQHTFIETCKMCGVSTLEYFKEFFKAASKREQFQMYLRNVEHEQLRIISKAIMQGRTDERSKSRVKLA